MSQIDIESPPELSPGSPVNTYRQAARLNRDPFTKESREKQKFLLLAASATIIIKLSILKIDTVAVADFKTKFSDNSVGSIAGVLAGVTFFYTLAFGLGAARDFAGDRFRTRAAFPQLVAPIQEFLSGRNFIRQQASCRAETDRLFALSHEEIRLQEERDNKALNSYRSDLESRSRLQENAAAILREAYQREGRSEDPAANIEQYISSFKPYDELRALPLKLLPEEREQLNLIEAELADLQMRIDTFLLTRKAENEASLQRQKAYSDEAFKLLGDWSKQAKAQNHEARQMGEAVRSLEIYRTASKWIEVIFPIALGLFALLLAVAPLLQQAWTHIRHLRH